MGQAQISSIKARSADGMGIDEICLDMNLPLAIVEEALMEEADYEEDGIKLPIIEDLKDVDPAIARVKARKYANLILDEVPKSLNKPEAMNQLGKASVVIKNLVDTFEKLGDKSEDNNQTEFEGYLKP